MSTIICLGGGIEGVPIIEAVKRLGHAAVVVDGNPDAPGMALADQAIVASCYDVTDTQFGLAALAWEPDAVLCCAVDAPHVAAAVADSFGLPSLTPAQAALSVDKVNQWVALSQAKLPIPDGVCTFYGATDLPGYGVIPLDLNPYDLEKLGDVVVKPADSRGGRGVRRVKLAPDPADEHDAVWEVCSYARRFSTSGKLIGQKFLPGPQLSTESLVQDGRVLFTAVGLRNYGRLDEFAPHIIEDGFDAPYPVDGVDELIQRACRALGWYQQGGGVVKGDLVIHDGDLVIIELAARLSGGFFCLSHEWAHGVPFIESAVRLALGERLEPPAVKMGPFVSQRYIFPEPGDIGRRVARMPDMLRVVGGDGMILPGARGLFRPGWITGVAFPCHHMTYAIRPGDIIQPVTSHGQRWGQAIATGDTPEQARQRAETAVAEMKKAVVLE